MKLTHLRKVLIAGISPILLSIGLTALPASAATTSGPNLHWNCGGQSQCAMVWGGMTGVFPQTTSAKCKAILNNWIKQKTMQSFNGKVGAWCDKVNLKSEKSPH